MRIMTFSTRSIRKVSLKVCGRKFNMKYAWDENSQKDSSVEISLSKSCFGLKHSQVVRITDREKNPAVNPSALRATYRDGMNLQAHFITLKTGAIGYEASRHPP